MKWAISCCNGLFFVPSAQAHDNASKRLWHDEKSGFCAANQWFSCSKSMVFMVHSGALAKLINLLFLGGQTDAPFQWFSACIPPLFTLQSYLLLRACVHPVAKPVCFFLSKAHACCRNDKIIQMAWQKNPNLCFSVLIVSENARKVHYFAQKILSPYI